MNEWIKFPEIGRLSFLIGCVILNKKRDFFVKNKKEFLFISFFLFFALTAYLFWLASRGIGTIDESQYIDVPHRLILGDRMMIDEWHFTQFSTPLQYPLFKLYYSIWGTEGIQLFFRYMYVVCQVAVSLFVFIRLQKKYGYTALIASLMYCHYTIINCFALSYYTMSIMASTVICTLLFTGEHTKKHELIVVGLCVSAAVLSEPFLAFVYFAYAIAVLIVRIIKKKTPPDELLSVKTFLLISASVFVCAAVFFVFFFSRTSIKEILEVLPEFFTDSEYQFPGLSEGKQNIFGFELFTVFQKIGLPFFFADGILMIAAIVDKKRMQHRPSYLILAGVVNVLTLITIYVRFFTDSYMFYVTRHIPLFIFGGLCCLLLQHKREHKRLIQFYCAGIVYSLILDISSANYTVVCLLGGVFSNIAVFPIAQELMREIREYAEENGKTSETKTATNIGFLLKKAASAALACVMIFSPLTEVCSLAFEKKFMLFENLFRRDFLSLLYLDAYETYHDMSCSVDDKIDTVIQEGPLKGIYTAKEAADIYYLLLKDLDVIKKNSDGPVYIFGLFPWMYLYLDLPYGTYTTWFVDADFFTRQLKYWDMFPERIPDYIYIPKVSSYGFLDMDSFCKYKLTSLKDYFQFETTETNVGYIIKLSSREFV